MYVISSPISPPYTSPYIFLFLSFHTHSSQFLLPFFFFLSILHRYHPPSIFFLSYVAFFFIPSFPFLFSFNLLVSLFHLPFVPFQILFSYSFRSLLSNVSFLPQPFFFSSPFRLSLFPSSSSSKIILIFPLQKSPFLQSATFFVFSFPAYLHFLSSCKLNKVLLNTFSSGLAGTILCKLQGFLALCTVNAAILTLAVIAADRFIAIFFPMRRTISSRTAVWLIAASWVAPALPSSLFLYVYRLFDFNGTLYCLEQWAPAIPLYINTIYSTVDIILFYALPLVEIIIFYSAIIYKIWMRKIPGQATSVNQQLELKAKKSVLKVLITAVLTFALFWLPTKILTMIALIGDVPCIMRSPLIRFVNLFLACMNCAINPFIYLIFSRDYRNGFKASCRCYRRLGSDFSHTHSQSMNMTEMTANGQQKVLTLSSFKKVEGN